MKQLTAMAWAAFAAFALTGQVAQADTPLPPSGMSPVETGSNWDNVQQVGYHLGTTYGLPAGGGDGAAHMPLPGYGPTIPQSHPAPKAGLYPSPVQNTPSWNDQTIITNQAFAPHEMLYPHEYHAMYGPYYYKVRGKFLWTPFGMRTHEKWELQGTEVKVKYHDRIRLFSGYHGLIH